MDPRWAARAKQPQQDSEAADASAVAEGRPPSRSRPDAAFASAAADGRPPSRSAPEAASAPAASR